MAWQGAVCWGWRGLGAARLRHDKRMKLWQSKFRAFAIHLSVSLAVAALAALVVFGVWYPFPYREISGGRELFMLIVTVDVVLGPLIMFTVFNPRKSRQEKILDFSVIGLIQIVALLYGLWTVYEARPVHTVFEYDRLRVVHATEVPTESLSLSPKGVEPLPVTGPTWLSLRPLVANEKMDLTMAALAGVPVAAQPALWRPYESELKAIQQSAHPATELKTRFPAQSAMIDRALAEAGKPADALVYLPLQARKDVVWTAILDRETAKPLAYLPLDSF